MEVGLFELPPRRNIIFFYIDIVPIVQAVDGGVVEFNVEDSPSIVLDGVLDGAVTTTMKMRGAALRPGLILPKDGKYLKRRKINVSAYSAVQRSTASGPCEREATHAKDDEGTGKICWPRCGIETTSSWGRKRAACILPFEPCSEGSCKLGWPSSSISAGRGRLKYSVRL